MSDCTKKGRCHHWLYRLTCEEFGNLTARAEGRCEICRESPEDTAHGMLHIDHDPTVGQWGVRGLLCGSCNTHLLTPSRVNSGALDAYLAQSWYLDNYLERPDEPNLGTILTVPPRRRFERKSEGWRLIKVNGVVRGQVAARTWKELWWLEGPRLIVRQAVIEYGQEDAA